jgi:two-component system, LuxR family, sensor kinase FixL
MSWITVIWSMVASACLTLAAMHLLIWCQKRTAWAHLLFALTAAGTASLAFCELWLMRAETIGEYGMIIRWGHVPYWVLFISLVAFARRYMRAGRLWLAWTACGLRTLSLILDFVFIPNINYREITVLRHVRFLGESASVVEGIPNPWMLVGQMSLLLFLAYVVDVTITLWRRGERGSKLILSIAMMFFIVTCIGQFVLAFWGASASMLTPSLFFLGIVAVMAWEMSRETIHAADLVEVIHESEERMTLAVEAAEFGVWMWNILSNQVWGTEKWLLMFGFAPDTAVSFEMIVQRIHPDDREMVEREVRRALADRDSFALEYRVILPEGTQRWVTSRGRVFADAHGKQARMLGVTVDISDRKQAEQEIAQQRSELIHVTRVSTVSQLASSLAHELNQPLGAILRNAEAAELFLQGPAPDLDEVRAILADIRKDDQRAGEVIDRMRALMRQHEAERCRIDLNLLAGDVVALVRPDAGMRLVRLDVKTDPALPLVHGDRVQLQQVLLNLLINAMDALDDNPSAKRLVTVRVRHGGAAVEVTVSDTGHGISEDNLVRMFEPFFSSKPNGLGMGLAISRGIIEAHGGRLWAKNNEAGGATFAFTLPVDEGGDAK